VDQQPNNPLHGVARAVDIRCFTHEPSLTSSLKFLRKVPWARAKVEALYLATKARLRAQP